MAINWMKSSRSMPTSSPSPILKWRLNVGSSMSTPCCCSTVTNCCKIIKNRRIVRALEESIIQSQHLGGDSDAKTARDKISVSFFRFALTFKILVKNKAANVTYHTFGLRIPSPSMFISLKTASSAVISSSDNNSTGWDGKKTGCRGKWRWRGRTVYKSPSLILTPV